MENSVSPTPEVMPAVIAKSLSLFSASEQSLSPKTEEKVSPVAELFALTPW